MKKLFRGLLLAPFIAVVLLPLAGQNVLAEYYGTPEAGCGIEVYVAMLKEASVNQNKRKASSASTTPPPPPPPPPRSRWPAEKDVYVPPALTAEELGRRLERHIIRTAKKNEKEREVTSDRGKTVPYIFRSGARFGLMGDREKILVEPNFHYITLTKRADRFIGYGLAYANLYRTSGERMFNEEFVFLEPLSRNIYIAQKTSGYGLIQEDGKVILPFTNQAIHLVGGKDRILIKVQPESGEPYVFDLVDGTTIPIPSYTQFWLRYKAERFLFVETNYWSAWLDLEEKKYLNCSDSINLTLFSEEFRLFRVQHPDRKDWSTINADGSLVESQFLSSARPISKSGLYLMKTPVEKSKRSVRTGPTKKGIVNQQGEWLVQPVFNELEEIRYPFFSFSYDRYLPTGMIDVSSGDTLVPPLYGRHTRVSPSNDYVTFYVGDPNRGASVVYDLKDGNKLFSIPRGLMLRERKLCDSVFFTATYNGTAYLYDKKGKELIVQENANIQFVKSAEHIRLKYKNGSYSLFNCQGKVLEEPTRVTGPDTTNAPFFRQQRLVEELYLVGPDRKHSFLETPEGAYVALPSPIRFVNKSGIANLTALKGDDQWMLVDDQGNFIIPPFKGAYSGSKRKNGYSSFSIEGSFGDVITPAGKLLFGGGFSKVGGVGYSTNFNLYLLSGKNSTYGIGTYDGDIVISPTRGEISMDGGIIIRGANRFLRDGTRL